MIGQLGPLLAQSGRGETLRRMSAFGGKADINKGVALRPL